MDGKHWIGCDGCSKWNHTDCEIARGTNKEYREAAEVAQRQLALETANDQNAASAQNQNSASESVEGAEKADVEMQENEPAKSVAEPKKQQESQEEAELPYFCVTCRKSKGTSNQKK